MSDTRTTETDETGADALHDDAGERADLSVGEFFGRIYRLFHNKNTGLTLILAMAVLTLLGTLLVQAPDSVLDDPAAYAHWVDQLRGKYRGWTGVLSALNLFNVFGSIWFKLVTIALSLSIVACTVHRLPQLWRNARAPHTHVSEHFYDHARQHATISVPVSPDQALERVTSAFRGRRYRTIVDPRGPGLNLYADAHRYAPFGTAVAHAAFVIILLGVLVSSTMGFKETEFTVTVGERADVGHETGLTIELASFTDTYFEDGQPKDYASDVVLFENGAQVASGVIRVNEPLRWKGVSFYQSYFGVAAVMTVTDELGAAVYSGGVPLQWQTDAGVQYGELTLPDGSTAYVISSGAGQVDVELYDASVDTPVGTATVVQGTPATVGTLTFSFDREQKFTGLRVAHDPGALWVWIGAGLLLAGMFTTMFFRHRRVWVRVHSAEGGSTVRVASAERYDTGFRTWFTTLVTDLEGRDEASRHDDEGRVGASRSEGDAG